MTGGKRKGTDFGKYVLTVALTLVAIGIIRLVFNIAQQAIGEVKHDWIVVNCNDYKIKGVIITKKGNNKVGSPLIVDSRSARILSGDFQIQTADPEKAYTLVYGKDKNELECIKEINFTVRELKENNWSLLIGDRTPTATP